ncbi:MAG: adenylosuccinate lyase [Anaerolineaceae bacterium 4572_5.1]|nr:MAG: adenylosuccinate lyase [Anaerolineaceae bacterium 4572_5.1]
MTNFETYLSPYTWRYGTPEMRKIWSETHKRFLWRQIWVALAEAQAHFGLVTAEQVADLRAHARNVDVPQSLAIEAQIHHDLMAEVKVYAQQCSQAGGIIHLGATSMDVKDNAVVLQIRQSLNQVLSSLRDVLKIFADLIEKHAETPIIAFTHLQPAEPSTLGYRLAQYAQDLEADYQALRRIRNNLRGKGFTGAVGTSASFAELLGIEQLPEFKKRVSELLNLSFFSVVTQTYPRRQDYQVVSALAGMGAVLYKFAFDLRILQSPSFAEWAEPFGAQQVGSSAMPFKRNPIRAEKMDSLARLLAQLPRVAWDNAAHSLLERTLDDSANRRTILPEAFLITDELLRVAKQILSGLRIFEDGIERNLENYAPFAATERVLMALGKAGADRQEMHERLRQHSLKAWDAVQRGAPNPLEDLIVGDTEIGRYVTPERLLALMSVSAYLGDAPQRALTVAQTIREIETTDPHN